MNLKILEINSGVIKIQLPSGSEFWHVGEIIDDTFPNSKTRRSRVQRGDISPTITATGMQHLFYYEEYIKDTTGNK